MGFLDKILGGSGSDAPFDARTACAAMILAAVSSDGVISDEEADSFRAVVNRMKLFREQSGADFSRMIDQLFGLLHREGPAALISKAAVNLPKDLRETVFALAADLVFADGHVEAREHAMLEDLQDKLEIPQDRAMQIVEVLMTKNRG